MKFHIVIQYECVHILYIFLSFNCYWFLVKYSLKTLVIISTVYFVHAVFTENMVGVVPLWIEL